MGIFDFLNPFFSERDFEETARLHKHILPNFLKLVRRFDKRLDENRQIEFFFYSRTMENAENLKRTLEKEGYEIYGIDEAKDGQYSVIGLTTYMSLDEKNFQDWIQKMNEYGFINDCEFDGWGMLSHIDE
nr:ribonuclease E inhibitor RraB [Bacteroidota bacterium]